MKKLTRCKKAVSIFWRYGLCCLKVGHLQVELSILSLLGWAGSRGIKATNLMAAQGHSLSNGRGKSADCGVCEAHVRDS
jgi:hypothetical protein